MKLNALNLYVKEKDEGYIICIDMPDNSRNYIHSEKINNLWEVQEYLKDLDGLELDAIDVQKDESYYRLATTINVGETADKELHFHSRKLNLNDVFFERDMILRTNE